MLDSLKLEAHGVPTAVVCTTVFADLAKSVVVNQGAEWYQPVIVRHASDLTASAIALWADEGLDQVVSWLLERE